MGACSSDAAAEDTSWRRDTATVSGHKASLKIGRYSEEGVGACAVRFAVARRIQGVVGELRHVAHM